MIDYSIYFNRFDRIEKISATFEKWHFWDKYPIIGVDIGLCPMNFLVFGERPKHLKKEQELEITAIMFSRDTNIDIYENREDYKKNSNLHMAPESIIPSGTFHPSGNPDYIQNESVIISGEVVKYDDFIDVDGDLCYKLKVKCLDYEFAVIIASEQVNKAPKIGNIIWGMFDFVGMVSVL